MNSWFYLIPWNCVYKYATKYDIKPELVGAIISVESMGEPFATRYEKHYRWLVTPSKYAKSLRISEATETIHQKTSWGLMQLMGANFRSLGYSGHLVKAVDVDINLEHGCKFLKALLAKYETLGDTIASYNAGSPRRDSKGYYVNESYVAKVMKYMSDL